jgi:soluble cytochrome b562
MTGNARGELCSQHSDVCKKAFDHERRITQDTERIDNLEKKVEKIEEVQAAMVRELSEASIGLRALATKIDAAVKAANGEGNPTSAKAAEEPKAKTFSQSLNDAWRHFQENFANFIIYCAMALFAWAVVKTLVFKEIPPMIKAWLP